MRGPASAIARDRFQSETLVVPTFSDALEVQRDRCAQIPGVQHRANLARRVGPQDIIAPLANVVSKA
jgi:hypothetical protein